MGKKDTDWFREEMSGDLSASIVALLVAVLLHLIIIFAIPYEVNFSKQEEDELQVDIIPPELHSVKTPPEFVEANPLANQNEPEANAPESFQNQRAAEELPDAESKSRRPYIEGEVKDGVKIVSGTNTQTDVSPQAVMDVLERPLEQQSPMYMQGKTPSDSKPMDRRRIGGSPSANTQNNLNEPSRETTEKSASKPDSSDDSKLVDKPSVSKSSDKTENIDAIKGDLSAPKEDEALNKIADIPEGISVSAPKSGSDISISEENKSDGRKDKNSEKKELSKKISTSNSFDENYPSNTPRKNRTSDSVNPSNMATGTGGISMGNGNDSEDADEIPEPLPQPKPRPQLSMRTPQGPLSDFRMRTSEMGTVAVDSRFSEFGAYQQRMIEAISRQWNLLASNFNLTGTLNTHVVIEYWLNTKGELTRIQVVFSNSSHTGRGLCEQSILSTAPYGEWSREMISSLGSQDQSVRINFYYR